MANLGTRKRSAARERPGGATWLGVGLRSRVGVRVEVKVGVKVRVRVGARAGVRVC